MNFVDVQPRSFLDYAWTSPSAGVMKPAKPSKAGRKQNRCCDQCRKGKRACDAAILEDTLLDTSKSGGNPTVFHYSDVFGPLTACSNCDKTKKTCTFDWLRSQRVSQALQPQSGPAPPAKRRRTQSRHGTEQPSTDGAADRADSKPSSEASASRTTPVELGVTFGDFPCGASSFDSDPCMSVLQMPSTDLPYSAESQIRDQGLEMFADMVEAEYSPPECASTKPSSLGTLSEDLDKMEECDSRSASRTNSENGSTQSSNVSGTVVQSNRKRRRRSPSLIFVPYGAQHYPSISTQTDLFTTTNSAYLTEGLLQIYQNSFENALSCWMTERTCPYSTKTDVSIADGATPDWNRIYHRVSRLDRLTAAIRGRQLTYSEDKAASRCLNLAIYAFASQWAQSSQRSRTKYPYQTSMPDNETYAFSNATSNDSKSDEVEFDQIVQTTAWYEARNALQSAGDIESFRVVLAQIVFALTQKPVDITESPQTDIDGMSPEQEPISSENECVDLMSRLNLAIETEGPPVHLEKGLRLIHSLRSKMAMLGDSARTGSGASRCATKYRSVANRLDSADRATVDLLFWLGVMFDTLSAAMNRRPLVVSDEDSNIYPNESEQNAEHGDVGADLVPTTDGLWDKYLFAHQKERLQRHPTRWPCSFDQAAAVLCDAAPVKVLLFRKVTRIQTLLSRNLHGEKIEKAIEAALDVCKHWNKLYAPFIRDCIEHHDRLPPRIQSWYTCLTGHWHLATLLLIDLIEIVDDSGLGIEESKTIRTSSDFIARFRETNCRSLSDLARCACPRSDATFPQSGEFHFAVSEGALLTEPWTAVLIRAFAKAGVVLLELEETIACFSEIDGQDAFQRADDCVKALWYLGRKSDMALSAAKILGDALRLRRKGAEEKVREMSGFLEAELWRGFEGFEGFEEECDG
ncbi:hypothetical protein T440DRAFT_422877 [Plenodomus tracheiphilus IPT5]|uniref:Uncharacterized protein n=1 Tax=Plenodomus tracheiphilus IPT5 TaxID=1408161 RepID=A0A6A7B7C0_9PLEO|nr:hypothetical protein T440DRAFT_422877 [Plenodomus tracheiphilus IPT5]